MSARPAHTPYHPKWFRRRVSVWWWLKSGPYVFFVLRELTSVFVALVAFLLLALVRAVAEGPEAYARLLVRLQSPLFIVLSGVAFLSVLFHTVTWFNLAPKAVSVCLGGKKVPDWAVAGLNYAAWLFLSGAVAFILLRG